MAVDYTKLDTYKSSKNTYQTLIKDAKQTDKEKTAANRASRAATWAGYGATIGSGGGALGSLIGMAVGALASVFTGDRSAVTESQREAYASINSTITTNLNEVQSNQSNRNTAIVDTNYFINQSRSNFESTYGKDSFSMLEATIVSLLDLDSSTAGQQKMSELLGGLKTDEILGQIETRLLSYGIKDENGKIIEGRIDRKSIDALNSAYVDISSLGSNYVEYLYNSILNSDTEIGDQARQLSESENLQTQQLDQNIAELAISNQQKFSELFLNQRSSNISTAQSVGETEAASGASGIKASKSSRTNANYAKLQADIADASYGIMLNSYKQQLKSSIESNELSRSQVYYSSRQQMKSLKRQISSSVNQSINSYLHGTAQSADKIASYEMNTDNYMAAVEAGKAVLKDENQQVNDTRKYIYTTGSATI